MSLIVLPPPPQRNLPCVISPHFWAYTLRMHAHAMPLTGSAEAEAQRIAKGLRSKDLAVMNELIDWYQYRLARYLFYVTGKRENVEDLAQETWVRVLERGTQYDGRSRFEPWLFSIARNLAFDQFRKRRAISLDSHGDKDSGDGAFSRELVAENQPSPFLAAARSEDAARLAYRNGIFGSDVSRSIVAPISGRTFASGNCRNHWRARDHHIFTDLSRPGSVTFRMAGRYQCNLAITNAPSILPIKRWSKEFPRTSSNGWTLTRVTALNAPSTFNFPQRLCADLTRFLLRLILRRMAACKMQLRSVRWKSLTPRTPGENNVLSSSSVHRRAQIPITTHGKIFQFPVRRIIFFGAAIAAAVLLVIAVVRHESRTSPTDAQPSVPADRRSNRRMRSRLHPRGKPAQPFKPFRSKPPAGPSPVAQIKAHRAPKPLIAETDFIPLDDGPPVIDGTIVRINMPDTFAVHPRHHGRKGNTVPAEVLVDECRAGPRNKISR